MTRRARFSRGYHLLTLIASPRRLLFSYLDPGSGSLLVQAIVAFILTLGVVTRRFWRGLFSRGSRDDRKREEDESSE